MNRERLEDTQIERLPPDSYVAPRKTVEVRDYNDNVIDIAIVAMPGQDAEQIGNTLLRKEEVDDLITILQFFRQHKWGSAEPEPVLDLSYKQVTEEIPVMEPNPEKMSVDELLDYLTGKRL